MSGDHENSGDDVTRRTFMQASGAAAGAGLLGAGAAGTAAAADADDIDERLLNWRTVEAKQVWDRGYRGRPDRTLALTDSPADARHAELAPWNDVFIEKDGDGIQLKAVSTETKTVPVESADEFASASLESSSGAGASGAGTNAWTRNFRVEDPRESPVTFDTESFTGTAAGANSGGNAPFTDFTVPEQDGADYDAPIERHRIDATLTWEPENPVDGTTEPSRAEIEIQDADENTIVASSPGANGLRNGGTERRVVADVAPDAEYRIRVYPEEGVSSFEVDAELQVVLDEPRIDADAGDIVDTAVTITGRWNRQVNETAAVAPADVEVAVFEKGTSTANDTPVDSTRTTDTEVTFTTTAVEPGTDYYIQAGTRGDVTLTAEFEVAVQGIKRVREDGELVTEQVDVTVTEPFEGDPVPDRAVDITPETPKLVGFYNEAEGYVDGPVPRDPRGHGTHVSGIMTGTGRGSAIDLGNTSVERPQAILLPGEFIEYDVTAASDETVFASAIGEGVKVEIVDRDGVVIHEAPLRGDSIVADEPAPHEDDDRTYTVRIRPFETESASDDVAGQAQEGNPGAARLQRIAYGTYRSPFGTTGERIEGGDVGVHPGLAPNASLVSLAGLSGPTADLNDIADDLAETFNMRAINMSWGPQLGIPAGQFGGEAFNPIFASDLEALFDGVTTATEEGILVVAAAGNAFTPANGNGVPAVAPEAISVVATGPFDGITTYSSNGIGGTDGIGGEFHGKPDVTAPGGDIKPDAPGYLGAGVADSALPVDVNYPAPSRFELVRSALAPGSVYDSNPDEGHDPPRDYVSVGGTSMASPYVCGVSGLVAQAMEEDAPDAIALPAPGEADIDDTMRLKQVILATANETVFTAAPYHTAKNVPNTPVYTHGGRDPYEGYGRANPDAAVDAVTRPLLGPDVALGDDPVSETHRESVGTFVPEDARAVAGYVQVPGGTLDVSVEFTDYSGGNKGMAKGSPHLDLFVYDAVEPADNGEPNVVASARAERGSGSVSVDVGRGSREDPTERVFYVVAKIVNVPGVVNGFDVQANFDLSVSFEPAAAFPPITHGLDVGGARDDDASAFTGGQSNEIVVEVDSIETTTGTDAEEVFGEVRVRDEFPADWEFRGYASDGEIDEERSDDDRTVVDFGTVDPAEFDGETYRYLVKAPEGAEHSGRYTFGPASAEVESWEVDEQHQGSGTDEFGGTDTNTVAGPDV